MLTGGMQDTPLLVTNLLDHAAREHGEREIVTRWTDGRIERSNWASVGHDARRFAQALARLGIVKGDRVGTLAMNHVGHLVSWYGAAGIGAILHTINPRLFDEQIVYIINHAADRVLLFDKAFLPVVERLRPQLPGIERFILFDAAAEGDFASYGEWLSHEDGDFAWTPLAESDPCGLCYSSGTTGDPKGVLYQNRSQVLHAYAAIQPDGFDLSARSTVLPVVPMFHANAWGVPFAAAVAGAGLVFSASNDAAVLWRLIREEGVTHSAGVPTIWLALFAELDASGGDFGKLRHVIIGGSAAPRATIERLLRNGVYCAHAWGMTETSPIGTVGSRPHDWDVMDLESRLDLLTRQGRAAFGVELRIIDDDGNLLPRDGWTSGRLQVRGPWVIKRYFGADHDAVDAEGWFDTGDVAMIHPDGTMQITDRAKDVIKSGGEWISSIDLENAAIGCAGVAEAAAIGIPHPKWDERPLLLVVPKPGTEVTAAEILEHLGTRVARWWLPDEIHFVDALPHTPTGKLLKRQLREDYRDFRFESLRD